MTPRDQSPHLVSQSKLLVTHAKNQMGLVRNGFSTPTIQTPTNLTMSRVWAQGQKLATWQRVVPTNQQWASPDSAASKYARVKFLNGKISPERKRRKKPLFRLDDVVSVDDSQDLQPPATCQSQYSMSASGALQLGNREYYSS